MFTLLFAPAWPASKTEQTGAYTGPYPPIPPSPPNPA